MADVNKNHSVDDVFDEAVRRSPGEARQAYLEEVCGDDSNLRKRVDRLLKASEEANSFLESPAADLGTSTDSPIAEKPGDKIDQFKLLQQIGEGGFGVVYMAEQLRPVKRKVALKIIKPGMDTKEVIARFDAERQAMALMDHANIAKVFDGGATNSGRTYFVMELVKGVALTGFCNTNRLTMRQRLELFGQVCRAIQHAHQKGVIHRDIKPTNVMVTLHDGKPVPKVIDFGVAKAIGHELTERTMFTAYGQMIGTPQYMSPEQAEMSGLDVDTRSDVYSLGVLLYELITGTTPLEKKTIQHTAYHELLRQIREVDAPKPSARISTLKDAQRSTIAQQRRIEPKSLRQLLHGDLDRVVLKALAKDRERRYETPKDLAADIERFLDDKPVQAVPPSPLYLARKFTRRHKAAIVTAAAIIALLVLTTAVSTWQAFRATEAEIVADSERNAALVAKRNAMVAQQKAMESEETALQAQNDLAQTAEEGRRLLYVANMQLADQSWNRPDGNPREIEELLARWIPVDDDQEDLREFSWRYQWSRLHQAATQFVLDTDAVTISAAGNLVTADEEGIREWSEGGKHFSQRWFGDASQALLSADGRWAVIPGVDGAKLIDVTSKEIARKLTGSDHVFCPWSKYIAYRDGDGGIQLDKVESDGGPPQTLHRGLDPENFLYLSELKVAPDGKAFLIRNVKDVVTFLHSRADAITLRRASLIHSFDWSPDGQFIVVGKLNGEIDFLESDRPEHSFSIGTHGTSISALAFSKDGTRLATGGADGTIDVWDISSLRTGQDNSRSAPMLQFKAHVDEVRTIVFSSNASTLATLGTGGVAKLWDLEGLDRDVYEIEKLTSESDNGRLGIDWDAADNGVCVQFIVVGSPAELSGKIELGDRIVGISSHSQPNVMDVRGMNARHVTEHIEIGPYGSSVQLHMLRRRDNSTYHVELVRNARRDSLFRLAYAPEGHELTVAGLRVGATRWTDSGQHLRRFPALGPSVAYSADGRFLALTAVWSIQLWDRAIDEEPCATLDASVGGNPIPGNRRGGSLAFSPDSRFLAIGTCFPFNHRPKRSDLRVWRIPELKEIESPLHVNDHVLASVLFTPDGKELVALDHSGVIRTWNTATWRQKRQWGIEAVQQAHSQFEGPDWQGEFITKATAMDLSANGRTLAVGFGSYSYEGKSGGDESGVMLIDFKTEQPLRVMKGHQPAGLVFSPNGRTLVTTGRDHKVVLWDVHTGRQLRELRGHTSSVSAVDFSPDGEALATASTDHILRIWRAAPFDQIDRHPLTIRSLCRLGVSQAAQGNHLKALATLRRALLLQEKTLPSNHPDIRKTRDAMAAARKGQSNRTRSPLPVDDATPKRE